MFIVTGSIVPASDLAKLSLRATARGPWRWGRGVGARGSVNPVSRYLGGAGTEIKHQSSGLGCCQQAKNRVTQNIQIRKAPALCQVLHHKMKATLQSRQPGCPQAITAMIQLDLYQINIGSVVNNTSGGCCRFHKYARTAFDQRLPTKILSPD